MRTVETYIEEQGLNRVLEEVSAIRRGKRQISALPSETHVEEEDWLTFLRELDSSISPSYVEGPLPVPSFNHMRAERLASLYIEARSSEAAVAPTFGDVVSYVAGHVDADEETVATYLEGCQFEGLRDARDVA